mmetsp:Transcript_41424/g.128022  ORF Transcript_41424/g.128022 Transcript_41424/m.128022 type:complete len:246 (-) Transcript_41424:629-1366(-)
MERRSRRLRRPRRTMTMYSSKVMHPSPVTSARWNFARSFSSGGASSPSSSYAVRSDSMNVSSPMNPICRTSAARKCFRHMSRKAFSLCSTVCKTSSRMPTPKISSLIAAAFFSSSRSSECGYPAFLHVSTIVSVATLPVSDALAKGQPPMPPRAPSKRRHPALSAARSFRSADTGPVCRCAPKSMSLYRGVMRSNNEWITSASPTPAVSAREIILTPRSAICFTSLSTIIGEYGSPYGLPKPMEM